MRWLKLPNKPFRWHTKPATTAERNSLALKHYKLEWTAREAAEMVDSVGRIRVYADLPLDRDTTYYQSTVLDFDLMANTLTLEPFFPRLPMVELFRIGPFELRLNLRTSPIKLLCLPINQDAANDASLHLMILEKRAKIAEPECRTVQFDALVAPSVELFMPLCGVSQGSVAQLSDHKVTLTVLNLPALPTRQSLGTCIIRFTEQFHLQASLRIRTVKCERKPYRHFVIQADFVNADSLLGEKLQTLLAMLENNPAAPPLVPV